MCILGLPFSTPGRSWTARVTHRLNRILQKSLFRAAACFLEVRKYIRHPKTDFSGNVKKRFLHAFWGTRGSHFEPRSVLISNVNRIRDLLFYENRPEWKNHDFELRTEHFRKGPGRAPHVRFGYKKIEAQQFKSLSGKLHFAAIRRTGLVLSRF